MPRILVTDDSEFMRQLLVKCLTDAGFKEILQAENGPEAVKKYKAERPDLVLMDVIMGTSLSGMDALKDIRAFDPEAKVIMITVIDQPKVTSKARELGAADYVTKPIDPKALVATVKKVLKAK